MLKMTDSEIEQRVLRALGLDGKIKSKELCVSCCDGVVTLAGTVGDRASKQAAETASRSATGVLAVVNTIAMLPLPVAMEKAPLAHISKPVSPSTSVPAFGRFLAAPKHYA